NTTGATGVPIAPAPCFELRTSYFELELLLALVLVRHEVRVRQIVHLPLSLELFGRRRRRRRRLFVRDRQVLVPLEARARRDQPAHRHVLLEAAQMVDLARDRRFREDARRLLERGGRDERVGRERRLRDAEQQRTALRRTAAARQHALVLFLEAELVHLFLDEELGVA